MNNIVEIIPLSCIIINNKKVNLLDNKLQIEKILGNADICRNSYYYFDNELRIDFNEDGLVEFIEILSGIDGKLQPVIYGVKVFQEDADYIKNILEKYNNGDIDNSENGFSYAFFNISIGVFREYTPESILNMKECISKEEFKSEMRKANHWDTIGIGG